MYMLIKSEAWGCRFSQNYVTKIFKFNDFFFLHVYQQYSNIRSSKLFLRAFYPKLVVIIICCNNEHIKNRSVYFTCIFTAVALLPSVRINKLAKSH